MNKKNIYAYPAFSIFASFLVAVLLFSSCSREMAGKYQKSEMRTAQVLAAPAGNETVAPEMNTSNTTAQAPEIKAETEPAQTNTVAKATEERPATDRKLARQAKVALAKKEVRSAIRSASPEKLLNRSSIATLKDKTSTSRSEIEGDLRTALIFIIVGLIVGAFSRVHYVFAIIGSIFLIVGLIYLLLWLLSA